MNPGYHYEEEELIKSYFIQGYTNTEILEYLRLHNIDISLSTLKRRLSSMQLCRRQLPGIPENRREVKAAIEEELGGSGCFIGYRKMWWRLKQKGLVVRRETVREMLVELDPIGVETRRKKKLRRRVYSGNGPNFIWHIVGHDKLKPYGFSIHGCIDGFSRRLIWLEVGPTNKKPEVIAKYYLDAIKQVGGVPRKVRSDDGTENCMIEAIHTFLRTNNNDEDAGLSSFLIGSSTSNQRIEAYWSHLVREGPGWWQNFFKDLRDLGLFNDADPVQVDCIRFCFMRVLRKELNEVAKSWNQHIISSSKFDNSGPRGRPDNMYFLPHLYQTEDYKLEVDSLDVDEFYNHASMVVQDTSEDFKEFATLVMNENGLLTPTNVREALNLYVALLQEIERFS